MFAACSSPDLKDRVRNSRYNHRSVAFTNTAREPYYMPASDSFVLTHLHLNGS
jgi:hypothetical protein